MASATLLNNPDPSFGLTSLGEPEDLELAASLVPNARVFAALRMSKRAVKLVPVCSFVLCQLDPLSLFFLPAALIFCFPCLALFMFGVSDSLKNTLFIITDRGITTTVVDHKMNGCCTCRTGKEVIEIPYESIALIDVITKKFCFNRKELPTVHLIVTDSQPRDRYLCFEEPEAVVIMLRQLKLAVEQNITSHQNGK